MGNLHLEVERVDKHIKFFKCYCLNELFIFCKLVTISKLNYVYKWMIFMNYMIKGLGFCYLLSLTLYSLTAEAVSKKEQLIVDAGYVRASIPGTNVSSAYMDLINEGENPTTLIKVTSAISPRIEIHEHIMTAEVMKMRKRDSLTIAAQSKITLQPSGYHLMIFDLKVPLQEKQQVTFTMHFNDNTTTEITLPVASIKQKAHRHH